MGVRVPPSAPINGVHMQYNKNSLRFLDSPDRLKYLAFLTAFTVILHILETFIPKPVPFLRFGLANIIVLMLVVCRYFKEAVAVAVLKTITGGLFTGMLLTPGTLIGLSGSALSISVMSSLIYFKVPFSIIGLSISGAVAHNFGQILVLMFIMQESGIIYLTPLLIVIGIVSGAVIGYIAHVFLIEIEKRIQLKKVEE